MGGTIHLIKFSLTIASMVLPLIEPFAVEGIQKLIAAVNAREAGGATHLSEREVSLMAAEVGADLGAVRRSQDHAKTIVADTVKASS